MSIIFHLMTLLAFFVLLHIWQFLNCLHFYIFIVCSLLQSDSKLLRATVFHVSPDTQFFSQYLTYSRYSVNALDEVMPRWGRESAESFLLTILWHFPSSPTLVRFYVQIYHMTVSLGLQFFEILHYNCWCLINPLLFKALLFPTGSIKGSVSFFFF